MRGLQKEKLTHTKYDKAMEDHAEIYEDTIKICDKKDYESQKAERLNIDELLEIPFDKSENSSKNTLVRVFNMNPLTALSVLIDKKYDVMYAYASNEHTFGGCVTRSIGGDEEHLFRCCNISSIINEDDYPIKEDECLYLPLVTFIKDECYEKMKSPFVAPVLSIPVNKNPRTILIKKGNSNVPMYEDEHEVKKIKRKLESIFKVAKKYNKGIVIGAYGLAQRHPKECIVELLNECIKAYKPSYIFICIKQLPDYVKYTSRESVPVGLKDEVFMYFHENINRNP